MSRNSIVNTPLAASEILQKVGCKFLPYERIPQIQNINELLPQTLILYQLAEVGHFCCVFENDEGINFFDPYGEMIDSELKRSHGFAPNHDFTYLINLLSKSNKNIIYNNHKLQQEGATCGHWCGVRMACNELYCDEFARCFRGEFDRDYVVAKIFFSL